MGVQAQSQSDSLVQRYKARLVVQGFSQKHGLDYVSLVVRFESLRTVIALAV